MSFLLQLRKVTTLVGKKIYVVQLQTWEKGAGNKMKADWKEIWFIDEAEPPASCGSGTADQMAE